MKISPARTSAFDILLRIERERAFSSVLLPLYEEKLENKDRALCHRLVLGVLRRKLYLDEIVSKLTGGKSKKFDPEVLTALRLGLFQLSHLDRVPDHSAINESVELVKRAGKRSASGLVNAVLRRAARERPTIESPSGDADRIALEQSHPRWLIVKWAGQFGLHEAEAIARANNRPPGLTFRPTARFYQLDPVEQSDLSAMISASADPFEGLSDGYRSERITPELRELAGNGLIYFQDAGSQLVAASVGLSDDELFLDVCASPGSKTTCVLREQDRFAVAGDLHPHRVSVLRENCAAQGLERIGVVRYDATDSLPFAGERFDAVLVDAPCTGTGTIRSNPEIRYHLSPPDISELASKQLSIIGNASKMVKKGGRLIYSTCSLEREENESVVERFLSENQGFGISERRLPQGFVTGGGFVRIMPHEEDSDGFFIAVLRRSR